MNDCINCNDKCVKDASGGAAGAEGTAIEC